jgi:hypothetical protein
MRTWRLLAAGCVALGLMALASACGGSSGSATAMPAAARTTASESSPTAGSGAVPTPAGVKTPAPDGTPLTAEQAPTILDAAMLKPGDLPAADGWKSGSDMTVDNAQVAASDPTAAASNDRCKLLLGRTVTLQPADIQTTYINGGTVTFFTSGQVYATASGAADCAAAATTQYQKPGQLARAFGNVFTDPDNVVVTPVDFPTIGDGSFAVTLAGRTNANGLVVDLTILAVGFREGAVNIVVGSAAASDPSVQELTPLVTTLDQRIAAAQQ